MTPAELTWLVGAWVLVQGDHTSHETWRVEADGSLAGAGRTLQGGRVLSHEQLRIVDQGGLLVYLASPMDRAPTPFALVELASQRAVFANPLHDFPRRIAYWREGERLCARIDGGGEQAAGDAAATGGEGIPPATQWCWDRAPAATAD